MVRHERRKLRSRSESRREKSGTGFGLKISEALRKLTFFILGKGAELISTIYDLKFQTSYVPAQLNLKPDISTGGLLREIAAKRPNTEALLKIAKDGQCRRR